MVVILIKIISKYQEDTETAKDFQKYHFDFSTGESI